MIIRNLDISECARLAEIDPSFETSQIYQVTKSKPAEPYIERVECDSVQFVMPPIFGSTSPSAALRYEDEFDRYDLFLVAEEDDRIIGAVCSTPLTQEASYPPGCVVMPREYLLAAFAVDREKRGQKVGAALLDRVKDHCKEIGCSFISLWAGFDYVPAVDFYISQGFVISGWLEPPGCRFDQCRIYLTWHP